MVTILIQEKKNNKVYQEKITHGKQLLKIVFKYDSQSERMEIASKEHFLAWFNIEEINHFPNCNT